MILHKIGRLALKLGSPVDQDEVKRYAGSISAVLPGIPVYMLLNPINDNTMQAALASNVSKFIVSKRAAEDPDQKVKEFLSRATDVVYRALQS